MSDLPASSYLDQIANEGAYDSSGDFTISLKAAIEKLGASQLPRESAWVLKVVQAGVSLGAAAIEVKQGSSVTFFAFSQSGPVDLPALQIALLSTDFAGPTYIQHLVIALRAVGFSRRRPFLLSVSDRGQCQSLIWDGEELRQEDGAADPALASVVYLEVEFSAQDRGRIFGASASAVRAARDESAELVDQAAVCPVPLTLDGRRLDVLSVPGVPLNERLHGTRQALVCLAWSPPASGGDPGLRLPNGVDLETPRFHLSNPLKNRLTNGRAFSFYGAKKERASEFLCRLSYHYKVAWSTQDDAYQIKYPTLPPSLIHWVIDGVVCASVAYPNSGSAARMDLYVSAADQPTDISGLIPTLEGPVAKGRVVRAQSFARSAIQHVGSEMAGHQHNYLKAGGLIGSGAALLTVLGGPYAWAAGLAFGVLFSPAIGMVGIEAVRASKLSKRLTADCRARLAVLDEHLRTRKPG